MPPDWHVPDPGPRNSSSKEQCLCLQLYLLGGRTGFHVFSRDVNAYTYRDDILDAYECPYAGAIGDAFVLQDDNTRPHKARIVDTYLEQETI
ncbi:DDE_3 domain-containing protein [Trichonephila clavipes]|nr:DDE_3 domain-containing protein [Trichonephila clavipes]